MWWAIVTLTTVGYGDAFPVTPLGRFFGGIVALTGIGLIALPTGVLAASFSNALERQRQEKEAARAHRDREEE
jgi:voltage-gated potassium channel